MASHLAFQAQLTSIMEVLANAAVAEIFKLVDDDYAVVSLQMSQCQRENKALKRKLHLMELKMARCFAERRLRDSAASIGGARVHVGGNDRFRSSSTASGVVFEGQMDMGSWPGRAVPGAASTEPTTCDQLQNTSADVELVEAELVKQEKIEETEEEVQEEVQLTIADGQLETGPGGGQVQLSSHPQQDVQADYHHSECPDQVSASTRGEEQEGGRRRPEIMLVKQEAGLEIPDHANPTIIIQEVCSGLPFDNTNQAPNQTDQELTKCVQGSSEPPAVPQDKPSTEPCTPISPDTGTIDTQMPANSTSHQPRRPGSEALATECSVLDLEALFTRWTPDSGAPPAALLSCSFSTEELLLEEQEEEGVLVEKDQPVRKMGGASQRSSRIQTNHSPYPDKQTNNSPFPGTPLSVSLRIQAPPPQLTWMMRTTQSDSLQQGLHNNKTTQYDHHSPQNQLSTTLTNVNPGLGDLGHCTGTLFRHLPNFPSFPPAGLSGSKGPALGGVGSGLSSSGVALGGVDVGQDGVNLGSGSVTAGLGGVISRLGGVSRALGGGSSSRLCGGSRRRNYVCRACGKAFSGLSNLEAHQRVHTGEKPFSCSTCGKRFSEAGNLKKHQRVHTGDKPYGCHRCGKRFAWVCSLRTHQQTGAGCSLQGGGPGGLDQ